jgi:hypothetical protein
VLPGMQSAGGAQSIIESGLNKVRSALQPRAEQLHYVYIRVVVGGQA